MLAASSRFEVIRQRAEAVRAAAKKEPPVSHPDRPLTQRQAEILHFIRAEIRRQGYAPSLREIGARFGINSTNGVTDHLVALERKGAIKLAGKLKSRGITVLGGPCPMCGGER